jgi:hypothetical protein
MAGRKPSSRIAAVNLIIPLLEDASVNVYYTAAPRCQSKALRLTDNAFQSRHDFAFKQFQTGPLARLLACLQWIRTLNLCMKQGVKGSRLAPLFNGILTCSDWTLHSLSLAASTTAGQLICTL